MAGENDKGPRKLDRREVLMGLSTVPALGLFGYAWNKQRQHQSASWLRPIAVRRVAGGDRQRPLLGAGAQGQVTTDAMIRIPGLRFRAVCDIWTEYAARRVVKHPGRCSTAQRRGLPRDARQGERARRGHHHDARPGTSGTRLTASRRASTCTARRRCRPRSRARNMVAAARETGKLLHRAPAALESALPPCYDKLIGEAKLLGRVVTVNGQWNRGVTPDLGAPDRCAIPADRLKMRLQGHAPVPQLALVKGLGGGPIVDLGSHQIDIYSWFLSANPSHVTASGGLLYYDRKTMSGATP